MAISTLLIGSQFVPEAHALTTGWKTGGTVFTGPNLNGYPTSARNWASTSNLQSEDGSFMTAWFDHTVDWHQTTNEVGLRNLGFALPSNALITNIEIDVKFKIDNTGWRGFGGSILPINVGLTKDAGSNQCGYAIIANDGTQPTTTNTWWTYASGSPSDFSCSLSYSDVNSANFGFFLEAVAENQGYPADLNWSVDNAKIQITYSLTYILSVTSTYDTATGAGTYVSGASVSSTVTSPVSGGAGVQYVCTGWTGTGSAPASGSGTDTGSFSIIADSSVTWNWKTQYQVTVTSSGIGTDTSSTVVTVNSAAKTQSQLPFTAWYDSGGSLAYAFTSPITGSSFTYIWASTSGLSQTLQSNTFTVSGTGTVIGTYQLQQYYLHLKVVEFDGTTVLIGAQITMNNGTDQVKTASSGGWGNYTGITAAFVTVKIKWENSFVNGSFTETMGANRTVTVVTKVYSSYALAWRFNDNSTAFTPTQVQLLAPNSTLVTLTGGSVSSLSLVQNGTWAVKSVTEYGGNVVAASNPTFTPTGDSQTRQMACRIYSIVLASSMFRDNAGAALYTAPSAFTITTPNATSVSGYGTYLMPNGTSTLTVCTWEGTSVVPVANTFDATSGNPTFSLKVYSLTLSFKDSSAATLYTPITSYDIQFPNSTIATGRTASSYSQVQTGTITLTNVLWEGSHVTAASNTYSLTSSSTWTMDLKVYALHLQHKDNLANLLTQNVQYTFPNSTAKTFTPVSGWIDILQVQNGTVTITTPIAVSGTERYVLTNSSSVSVPLSGASAVEIWRHDLKSVTLQSKDSTGTIILTPQPTSFTVSLSNGTSVTNPTSSMWLPTGTATLTAATWEGSSVGNSATVSITAQITYYFSIGVYSRTLTFRYNDGATAFVPTQVIFTAPNSTSMTLTSYSSILLQGGTSTITSITYWGNDVIPAVQPTFDASTGNAWINARIYSITPLWKDSSGAALYAQPTSFKWTPANTTLSGALTPGQAYWVQNGTATISAVTWKGSNVTPTSGTGFDPTSGSPTLNLRVYSLVLQGKDQSANLLSGNTTFTITFPNATTTSFAANSTAYKSFSQVQNGTYSLTLLWNSLNVNNTFSQSITANKNLNFIGLVYYTATGPYSMAVDQGTLSNVVASDQAISFTASATGSRTVKVYVSGKATPKGVYVDGTLKTLNTDYTFDGTNYLVSIPLSFSTHIIMVSWNVVVSGPTSGGGGGLTTTPTTTAQQVSQAVQAIVQVAEGNPYIVGLLAMGGLFGGAGLAYRDDRKRWAAFLAGMGIIITLDALFFWQLLPQTVLETNAGGLLPLTLNKYLIPIPSLALPTTAPTGEEIAQGIMTIGLLGLFVTFIVYALVHE